MPTWTKRWVIKNVDSKKWRMENMVKISKFLKKWDCIFHPSFYLITNRDYILIHTEKNSSLKKLNDTIQVILQTHVAEVLHQASQNVLPCDMMSHSAFIIFDIISSQHFLPFYIMSTGRAPALFQKTCAFIIVAGSRVKTIYWPSVRHTSYLQNKST